jgi:hypothetical protein
MALERCGRAVTAPQPRTGSPGEGAAAGAGVGFGRVAVEVAKALVRRPDLVVVATSALLRLARPRWWARPPFVPLPDEAYWRFRMVTAFGGAGSGGADRPDRPDPPGPPGAARDGLSADGVIAYLQWCRRMPAVGG